MTYVCNLEALAKSIMFQDMSDVFNILSGRKILLVESNLKMLFAAQNVINLKRDIL